MAVDIENEMETALGVLMGEDEEQTKEEKERFKRLIKASRINYDKLVFFPNSTDSEYLETYKPCVTDGELTCKNCTNCCCGCSKYCCRKFPYVCCFEERVIRKETRTEKLFAIFLFCLAFIICFAQIMELNHR